MTSSEDDPRMERAAEFVLLQFGSKSGSAVPVEGHRLIARRFLAAIDAADAAAGIRRVDEWDEKCIGCHQYYNAEGVRCYIDNERASHCLAAASERVGGAS